MKRNLICTRSVAGVALAAILGAGTMLATPLEVLAEVVPMTEAQKGATANTYWADELNAYWAPTLYKDADGAFVIPAYLNDFFATSKVNWASQSTGDLFGDGTGTFITPGGFGIHDENAQAYKDGSSEILAWFKMNSLMPGEKIVDPETGDEVEYPGHAQPQDPTLNHWQDGKIWVPYGWDPKVDLLWNVTDDDVYGDLSEQGASSTDVADHKRGDDVSLDFTVDASLLRSWVNTMLVSVINSEFPAYYTMKNDMPETGLTAYDSELVFVVDLPEGLETTDATSYELTNLDGFTLTATKEKDGKRLVVKARVEQPQNGYTTIKEFYQKLNAMNLKSLTLSVNGLKVGDDAPMDTTLTATGYAYGAIDYAQSSDNDATMNQRVTNDNKHHFGRTYSVFAAKQSAAGRDAAADAAKPNLITYSFKVAAPVVPPAPAQHTVTFMSGDAEVAQVKVEDGKAISTDGLADQSMPADPTREGYLFKGWNTVADGTGEAFTGNTVVNGDMTVYAVYTKTDTPNQEANQKTRRAVKKLPATGDEGLGSMAAMVASAAAALVGMGSLVRKRRDNN